MDSLIPSIGYVDVIGTTGTLVIVAAYLGTQMRFINSSDMVFPVLNLIGSLLIGFSLIHNFNFASALMEIFWIAISLFGILQGLFRRDESLVVGQAVSAHSED